MSRPRGGRRPLLLPAALFGAASASLVWLGALGTGCESPSAAPAGPLDAGASPNASILPAPLASEPPDLLDAAAEAGLQAAADPQGRGAALDAGLPPPEPLRPDIALPADTPTGKDVPGVSLEAAWRWRDVPVPPKAPEVALDGIREAQKLTALLWKIDLADAGRMRIDLASRAFPLPAHTEIRARLDRYGSLLLWPSSTDYRVLPPGALRTLLGERRVDVTPLSTATLRPLGDGRRLGVALRKLELGSSLGTLRLEVGKVPDAGDGGALLCRALVEIAGIDPRTAACQSGEVPLSAAYSWQDGGGVAFEVTSIAKHADLGANNLLAPPPGARFEVAGLPPSPDEGFLGKDELAAFRSAALTLPPRRDLTAPSEGILAVNRADTLTYLLLDGVPVAAVPANGERRLLGTTRGRYVAEWRTFLGERIAPPQTVELPARLVHGGVPDAGAPDGG
jgi:hypothetical protein